MPVKVPIFRYALLALLFAITVGYEVPYLHDILREEKRDVPLFSTESGTSILNYVSAKAQRAGFHKGDQLLTINGEPYRGASD